VLDIICDIYMPLGFVWHPMWHLHAIGVGFDITCDIYMPLGLCLTFPVTSTYHSIV